MLIPYPPDYNAIFCEGRYFVLFGFLCFPLQEVDVSTGFGGLNGFPPCPASQSVQIPKPVKLGLSFGLGAKFL